MADPKALAAEYPTEVWAALVSSLAIIGTLIVTLYKRLNADIKAHDEQLENGRKAFEEIGKDLVNLGGKISALSDKGALTLKEVEGVWMEIKDMEDKFQQMQIDCAKQHGGK